MTGAGVAVPPAAKQMVVVIGGKALKKLLKIVMKGLPKLNGYPSSKVKWGAYKGCKIVKFNKKLCIVIDPKKGKILYLTPDNIQSCKYVKKKKIKKAPVNLPMPIKGFKKKKYYYYDIEFIDGQKSRVRIRKKYRNAMP